MGLFSIFLHFQQLTENTCSVYLGSFHHSYTLQNFIIDIGFRYLKIVHDFTVKSHPPPLKCFTIKIFCFGFAGFCFDLPLLTNRTNEFLSKLENKFWQKLKLKLKANNRYYSVDLLAPTIVKPRVLVPSTIFTLLSIE